MESRRAAIREHSRRLLFACRSKHGPLACPGHCGHCSLLPPITSPLLQPQGCRLQIPCRSKRRPRGRCGAQRRSPGTLSPPADCLQKQARPSVDRSRRGALATGRRHSRDGSIADHCSLLLLVASGPQSESRLLACRSKRQSSAEWRAVSLPTAPAQTPLQIIVLIARFLDQYRFVVSQGAPSFAATVFPGKAPNGTLQVPPLPTFRPLRSICSHAKGPLDRDWPFLAPRHLTRCQFKVNN
jgi:hypothetical protein